MAFDPEDPRWTAYVLGELDDETRRQVEAELAGSPNAQRAIDDIRRTVDLVSASLQAEPCPVSADAEADDLLAARVEPRVVRPAGHTRWGGRRALLALAASLLAAVGMASFLFSGGGQIRQAIVALKHKPASNERPVAGEASKWEGNLGDSAEMSARAPEPSQFGNFIAQEPAEDSLPPLELQRARSEKPRHPAPVDKLLESSAEQAAEAAEKDRLARNRLLNFSQGVPRDKPTAAPESRSSAGADYGGGSGYPLGPSKETAGPNHAIRKPKDAGGTGALNEPDAAVNPRVAGRLTFRPGEKVATPLRNAERRLKASNLFGDAAAEPGDLEGAAVETAPVLADAAVGVPPHPRYFISGGELPEGVAVPFAPNAADVYQELTDNPFLPVAEHPLSTFSTDVDTASYSIVRRYLQQNHRLPPRSAVRIEELVNYFPYDYPQPEDGKPIAANVELAACPWNAEHRLLRVGIKARDVAATHRPLTNLVFLIDVSGSMQSPDKLPLVKDSLRLLTGQMGENDHVAIVVYAGNTGLVLPSTSGIDQAAIRRALDALEAGGSTNGAGGIQLAYDVAQSSFVKGGVNRVILATDGDFNVGITDRGALVRLIEQKAASGVFLTTLGYGMGNLKDATLEQLADKGNGNYAYIDNLREAKKVLVEQMAGTLVTVAKDVKIQIEFNPARVASFRLIGYENRILRHEEFNDDKKDAGDIGAGHTVTALYELVPGGQQPAAARGEGQPAIDPLKYQQNKVLAPAADTPELLMLKLRYKQPDGDKSQLLEYPVKDAGLPAAQATADFRFAASVALFGMLLRDSPYKGNGTLESALDLAQSGRGSDNGGYRSELIELINIARGLKQ